MIRKFLVGVCSLYTLFLFMAFGQNTGTLNGTITAADGSPVPSASVTVTDASGQSRSAIAAQDGTFSVTNLPPGTYTVGVEVPGFNRLTQENVHVSAGSPVNLQLGMQAGRPSDTVTGAGPGSAGG